MSISVAAYFLALIIQLDSAPTALEHIGWKYDSIALPIQKR